MDQVSRVVNAARSTTRRTPAFALVVEVEELPRVGIGADTFEDEERIRSWLAMSAVRRRLHEAIDDFLDALEHAA